MSVTVQWSNETPKDQLLLSVIIAAFKGEGKTSTALSFPSPLFFDWDGGLQNVAGVRHVPSLASPSYEEVLEVVMAVQAAKRSEKIVLKSRTGDGKIEEVEVPCRTVVYDSITKGHRKFLESAMAVGRRSAPAIQDWGLASQRVLDSIDMLKPFVNVVVINHFEIIKDGNLERVMAQIRVPGQLVDLLPISCDELWRLKSDVIADASKPGGRKRQVQLWTISDGIFPGATRFAQRGMPAILDITDKPDKVYETVMACIT